MDEINYRRFAAEIVVRMLPVIYKETPEMGNMVGNRERHAVTRTIELAEYAIQEIKGLKI